MHKGRHIKGRGQHWCHSSGDDHPGLFFSFCLCFETVSHLAWNFPLVLSWLATESCPVLRLCVHNNIQILSGGFSAQTPLLIPRRQVLDHLSYGPCSRSGFLHKPHGLSWVKKGRAQSLFPGMALSPMPTSYPWVKKTVTYSIITIWW